MIHYDAKYLLVVNTQEVFPRKTLFQWLAVLFISITCFKSLVSLFAVVVNEKSRWINWKCKADISVSE